VKKAVASNGLFVCPQVLLKPMWSDVNKNRHYIYHISITIRFVKPVKYRCIVMSYPKVLDKFVLRLALTWIF